MIDNLPFKENHPPLSDNYNLCIKRFKSLQKKLSKDDWLLESYNNVFKEQLQQGIIEPIIEENKIENAHYLPHQPVLIKLPLKSGLFLMQAVLSMALH